ncbi:MAG TPA: hypothetical protein DIT64_19395 [Verrucomicrobiales bacterium]|nr:hypothetical protein [Verrucomicrobiales bacterium]
MNAICHRLPALLLCCLLGAAAARAQPANLLLIIADDLGADSFPLTAAAGAPAPPMPNLSALKNSGVLFTSAYAHPTCSPTRASILTGRHPFRTGIGNALTGAASPQLQASEFTLPEAFAANPARGYALAMFGKWHLNAGAGSNDTPRTIGGWPHFSGTLTGALADYSSFTKITNGATSAVTTYATTDTADDVIAWIGAQGAGPWFAWAAFNAPHSPFAFPPDHLHSYDGAAATNRNMYEAMCEALDTEAGRILAAVSLAETNVIFLGDNGTPQNVIQTPYTSGHAKGTIYSGGVRVPMIIAGPAVAAPGRVSAEVVHAADLYATILELAGISVGATQPAGQALDSRSLLPILQNSAATTARTAFSQQFGEGLADSAAGRGVTDAEGNRLLVFNDGREEFYATAADANEGSNLLGASITPAAQSAYMGLRLALASHQEEDCSADPRVSSWLVEDSARYARIYPTTAAEAAGAAVTTWSRGQGVQSQPTYAGVSQVEYSADWVYLRATGLAGHVMGPWYLNEAKTQLFPNYPANQALIYRIPRAPVIPGTKTSTGLGATGRMVNGVAIFDSRDAFSYSTANATDATPVNGITGDGVWNRDGYHNEGVTFDPALAHQAGSHYHYHAHPAGLRHQLGDHVDYDAAANRYTESAGPPARHSPILGWAADGLPVYGPYGYASALDPQSGVRRMLSGFVPRDGANGTTNLAATGRTTLPAWAARVQNRSASLPANRYGPALGPAYLLGHYIEDYDYLGDLGFTQGADFDLNEQNARWCVTPEFPAGTWAYFTTILADGAPAFPYTTGRQYYGSPTGGAVTSITESTTTAAAGGPYQGGMNADASFQNGSATLGWTAVEGGAYRVEASESMAPGTWTTLAANVTAAGDVASHTDTQATANGRVRRFYRAVRTGVGAYDSRGFPGTTGGGGGANSVAPGGSAARGGTVTVLITLPTTPPLPPAAVVPASITLAGSISGTAISRPSQATAQATFAIPADAPAGAQTIVVVFSGPTYTMTGAFTINP